VYGRLAAAYFDTVSYTGRIGEPMGMGYPYGRVTIQVVSGKDFPFHDG
jgi:hypothetical protein